VRALNRWPQPRCGAMAQMTLLVALVTGCRNDQDLNPKECWEDIPDDHLSRTYSAAYGACPGGEGEVCIKHHPDPRGAVVLSEQTLPDAFATPPTEPLGDRGLRFSFSALPQEPAAVEGDTLSLLAPVRGLALAFITSELGATALGGPGARLGLRQAAEGAGTVDVEGFAFELDLVSDIDEIVDLPDDARDDIEPPFAHAALVLDGVVESPDAPIRPEGFVLATGSGEVSLQIGDDGEYTLDFSPGGVVDRVRLLDGTLPLPLGTQGRWAVIAAVTDGRGALDLGEFQSCELGASR
jgi:hypothetical protein